MPLILYGFGLLHGDRRDQPGSTAPPFVMAGDTGNIDALLVAPEIATLLSSGSGHFSALLTSRSGATEQRTIELGGTGPASIFGYDRMGRFVQQGTNSASGESASIVPGGFTVLARLPSRRSSMEALPLGRKVGDACGVMLDRQDKVGPSAPQGGAA